ncbi:MAG: molybdopterin-dependent oxidoreductase, partial [Clostridia bacterium]|nr:molybdopterin-dependent oxidoreductase [Clostridia bacterium]
GSPQAYTFSEQLIDMLAEKAGIDPFEFRYINAARPGDTTNNSMPYHVYPVVEMMDRMRPYYKESLEWAKEPASSANKKRGVGVSLGGFHSGNDTDKCEVWLELNPDGTITDYNCWQELGQGSDIGSVAMTCEALKPLNIRPDQVKLVKDDTGMAPMHGGSSGSRSQIASGQAHIVAANMLLDAMRKPDGTYRTYDEMVAEGIPTLHKGVWTSVGEHKALDPNTGVGDPMQSHNHNICVVRVEVDTETGEVEVLAARSIVDCGVIGNKLTLLGQAYGGLEHSIGFGLQEDYSDLEKKFMNMVSCGTLECNQMPDDIEFEFIETPRENGPFGSSGASEGFQSNQHTSVLNAIYNAVGVRIYEIPAKPNKIKEALKAKAEGKEIKPSPYYLGSDFDETMDDIKENPIGVKGKGDDH